MIKKLLGTLLATAVLATGAKAGTAATIEFIGPTGQVNPGDQFTVDIFASGFTTGLQAVDLFISYNTDLLNLVDGSFNEFSFANFEGLQRIDQNFSILTKRGYECFSPDDPDPMDDPNIPNCFAGGGNQPGLEEFDQLGGIGPGYFRMLSSGGNVMTDDLGVPGGVDETSRVLASLVFEVLPGVAGAAEALTLIDALTGQAGCLGACEPGFGTYIDASNSQLPVSIIAASVDVNVAVIPLPAAVWMMLAGIASLAGFRRK